MLFIWLFTFQNNKIPIYQLQNLEKNYVRKPMNFTNKIKLIEKFIIIRNFKSLSNTKKSYKEINDHFENSSSILDLGWFFSVTCHTIVKSWVPLGFTPERGKFY